MDFTKAWQDVYLRLAKLTTDTVESPEAFEAGLRDFLKQAQNDPDVLVKKSMKLHDPSSLRHHLLMPLMFARAYSLQAVLAYEAKQEKAAWSYLLDASYWLGIAQVTHCYTLDRGQVVLEVRAHTARKAGKQSHQGHEQTKEYAYQLATDRAPLPDGCWHSRADAVAALAADVAVYARDVARRPFASQPEETIAKWLKMHPDAAWRFPAKSGRPKKPTNS
ncbi:hypothetical protein [Chitiniphilus shinanonensis]|uniref:hypothetical protein n=1 Tax=Chitiniphilus shinanonensis TaxID=553088 RepID=UPI00333F6C60